MNPKSKRPEPTKSEKVKGSILRDYVSQEQYERLNYATSCEDCTHFDRETETCTFGYPTEPHLKQNQLADLKKGNAIAFCRAIEID